MSRSTTALRIVVAAAIPVVAFAHAFAAERPPADVSLGHWSYPFLERLEARGVIEIDLTTRPVSRSDVARAVTEAIECGKMGAAPVELTEREEWALSRLADEFLRGEVDSPVFSTKSGDSSFGFGVRLFTQTRYGGEAVEEQVWPGATPGGITPLKTNSPRDVSVEAPDDSELDVAADVDYELWGGLAGRVGFYADHQFLLGGQEGARKVRLSNRVRTWRGIVSQSKRAYIKLDGPSYSIVAGRRGTAWGRARWGRMLLSGAAPTLDQLTVRFRVGALSFEALHAFLEYEEIGTETDLGEAESVFLAGHRLVVRRGRWSVGVAEAAVYSSELPDPVYLNPLMPYYLVQHSERGNDNILWLVDGSYAVGSGITAYGEFLIDDLQYERTTTSPDKFGLTAGGAWYGSLAGLDSELTVEYSQVRKWTYTHKFTEHRFSHDGLPIGFELGPDSDRLRGELVVHPTPELSLGALVEHGRRGEGRLEVPYTDDEEHEPAFPSGVVESTSRMALEFGYQSLDRLSAGVGVAFESVTNIGNADGEDDDNWELWAGVQLRI